MLAWSLRKSAQLGQLIATPRAHLATNSARTKGSDWAKYLLIECYL